MKCECNNELIWGNDFDYEDMGIEDIDGIVSTYSCVNGDCEVGSVEVYKDFKVIINK